MTIIKESAPHLRRKSSVARMMGDVLIALAPTLIFAFVVYPINTLSTLLLSLFIMNLCEFIFVGIKNIKPKYEVKESFINRFKTAIKEKYTINNLLSASISAVIFTLIMPVGMKLPSGNIIPPIYPTIVGAFIGITFGKLVFGGLGSNIFNPAVVGMLVSKYCFGSSYINYLPNQYYSLPDALSGATPLYEGGAIYNNPNFSLLDMLLGKIPGTLGEVYKITIIVGLIYLLIRRSADFRIVLSYLATFIAITLVAGLCIHGKNSNVHTFEFLAYNLLSGGLLFGAVFMFTDPVTSPINSPARVMYGIIGAIATAFIRYFAALPEGVGYSILLANMIGVALDHYEWSSQRYTIKKIIVIISLIVISLLITFLATYYGGIYKNG